MTPARHELPPEPLKDENDYGLDDLKSDGDTDDEEAPRKEVSDDEVMLELVTDHDDLAGAEVGGGDEPANGAAEAVLHATRPRHDLRGRGQRHRGPLGHVRAAEEEVTNWILLGVRRSWFSVAGSSNGRAAPAGSSRRKASNWPAVGSRQPPRMFARPTCFICLCICG
jgi:hypothetical protein